MTEKSEQIQSDWQSKSKTCCDWDQCSERTFKFGLSFEIIFSHFTLRFVVDHIHAQGWPHETCYSIPTVYYSKLQKFDVYINNYMTAQCTVYLI